MNLHQTLQAGITAGRKYGMQTVHTFVKVQKQVALLFIGVILGATAHAQGTWSTLTTAAPHANAGVMLVLTDGTILCKTSSGSSDGTVWDKLTPNAQGSYKNGTWTSTAAMNDDRLYFSSQVLPDGRIYVAGGEYGSGLAKGETYNPLTNTWLEAPVPGLNISDANSQLLPNGKVLQAAVASDLRHTFIFDPVANTYVAGPTAGGIHNESVWVKLPDNSILYVDRLTTNSERYIPATNTWISDATVPVGLYDPYGDEAGAAFLLPNGKVFFIGSAATTALYTPSGTTAPGSWVAGPNFPGAPQGAPDAPAAMMVNGNILCVVSPTPTSGDHFPDSSVYFEYNYTTNAFTTAATPFGGTQVSGFPTYIQNMVCLPDGTIMFSYQGSSTYYIYTPGGSALTAGKPTVTNIIRPAACDTFKAVGTLFNGITEGAAYGDDWQNSSNYPLIRLTSGTNVYYARTYNWNRIGGVMTGAALDTVQFILPATLPVGTYTLQVVANGNASAGVSFSTCGVSCAAPAIMGNPAVCVGSTSALSDPTTGGTWTSANTAVAAIDVTSGVVTGLAVGTAMITYTVSGCTATQVVTVSTIAAITGGFTVCSNSTTTLSDVSAGGAWSSSNTAVATLLSTSGIVYATGAGTSVISYTSAAGCLASATVTVNAGAGSISGAGAVCVGSSIALGNSAAGGVWSSNSTSVASVDASGNVSGIAAGTAIITYTMPGGCFTTAVVTVNPISLIMGATAVCMGSTITLSDAAGSGTWSTTSAAVISVDASLGVVYGVAVGTDIVTYTSAAGCSATTIIAVNPSAGSISGAAVCVGASTILSATAGGGSWSSSATTVAAINAASGMVTGVSAGTTAINYSIGAGCTATAIVTVNALPAAIAGTSTVCTGATATLTNASGGGSWSSSNMGVAGIGAGTGMVTGVAAGTSTIVYTLPTGCTNSTTIAVNQSPSAIVGATSVCPGSTITLTDGIASGVWSGPVTSASVGAGTGIVTGISAGTVTITYALGSCTTTASVTVNQVAAITGAAAFCAGSSIALSNTIAGGTWSSGNVSVATVGSTGVVTGVVSGTAILTYTLPTGCIATATVTVNSAAAAIGGTAKACIGTTTTLTDGTASGTWSSSSTAIADVGATTGIVTGVAAGTTAITYSVGGGCNARVVVTINALPSAISGASSVCAASTTTLTDAGGGTWSSSTTTVANIGSSTGVITGVARGTSTITYTLSAGCKATKVISVNTAPAAITGATSVCQGSATTLGETTSAGTWSSSSAAIATVGSLTGIVGGVAGGSVTITYAISGCAAIKVITINAVPAITGTGRICAAAMLTLADASAGGTWKSGSTSIATMTAAGIVTGVATGTSIITYILTSGCTATTVVTVLASPAAITGTVSVCVGATTALADAVASGTWTSSTTAKATIVASSGIVTGIAAGTSTISYTLSSGCRTTKVATVNANPAAISGSASVCTGSTTTLTDAGGGTWSSSRTTIATVVSATGVVHGVAAGTTTITYKLSTGCIATKTETDAKCSKARMSSQMMTVGSAITLATENEGGEWSSSDNTIAKVNSETGLVTALSAGEVSISYIVDNDASSADVTQLTVRNTQNPMAQANSDVSIIPNPSRGSFVVKGTLGSTAADEEVTFEIKDMLGRVVYTNKVTVSYGVINEPIQLGSKLASGTYILNIRSATSNAVMHVVIEQ